MKRLKTDEGIGFPIRMDDLQFLTDGTEEAITALCEQLCLFPDNTYGLLLKGSYDIHGSGPYYATITNAIIYFNGKIYYVDEQTVEAIYSDYKLSYLEPESYNFNQRFFKDGSYRNVYTIPKLILKTNAFAPDGCLSFNKIKRLSSIWVNQKKTAWQQITIGNGWQVDPNNPIRYRLNDIGNLEIIGRFKVVGENASSTLFTLPSGFRPLINQEIRLFAYNSAGYLQTTLYATFKFTGEVSLELYWNDIEHTVDGYWTFCHTIFI